MDEEDIENMKKRIKMISQFEKCSEDYYDPLALNVESSAKFFYEIVSELRLDSKKVKSDFPKAFSITDLITQNFKVYFKQMKKRTLDFLLRSGVNGYKQIAKYTKFKDIYSRMRAVIGDLTQVIYLLN